MIYYNVLFQKRENVKNSFLKNTS